MAEDAILDQYGKPELDADGKETGNSIYVVIYRNGRIEAWRAPAGKDPRTQGQRVTPSDKELVYAQHLVEAAQKSEASAVPKPVSASAVESVPAPPTQRKLAERLPSGELRFPDNPSFTPEPTITRALPKPGTIGPEGQEQIKETVSVKQAEYDEGEATRLQTAAQQAVANARNVVLDKIAQDKWTAEQAATEYGKRLDQIRMELQQQTLALTRRGQDIEAGTAARGQEVSMRGQDFGILPYIQNTSQVRQTEHLIRGGSRETMPPFEPVPAQALLDLFPRPLAYVLPGQPPPQAPSRSYTLGGR